MQAVRLLQAVALMLIVALAASCTATKEYTSKLFAPRSPVAKDTQAVAIRFLSSDSNETEREGWVTTDIIMGRDTTNNTTALDNFAKVFPSSSDSKKEARDSANTATVSNTTNTTTAKEPVVTEEKTVAKNISSKGTREKRSRVE